MEDSHKYFTVVEYCMLRILKIPYVKVEESGLLITVY